MWAILAPSFEVCIRVLERGRVEVAEHGKLTMFDAEKPFNPNGCSESVS